MSIDLEQFHQIFFEESFEGLEAMESGLLNLDLGAADPEEINGIFRAAHSIKGGSGTFGFTAIADFTHVLETLLDEMRDGRRSVTKEAVDRLLESVDCLRGMLSDTQAGEEIDAARAAQVKEALEALLKGAQGGQPADAVVQDEPVQGTPSAGWRIRFAPHLHLFHTGNDPFRLLRELDALGGMSVRVDLSRMPALEAFDPEDCYLSWEIVLEGDVRREEVAEIFEWVEDDCDLHMEPLAVQENDSPATKDAGGDPPLAEETVAADNKVRPPAQAQPRPERRSGAERRASTKDTGSIRVNIDKIDSLINMVGELVITQSMLSQLNDGDAAADFERLRDGLEQLERNTRELQESVMQIRMLPISFSFNRFPRLVRDLSGKLNKQVELVMSGEQTELDKTVLEKIGDPLVHLVRNSLDHGIESPELRRAAGKPEIGTIRLNAYHQGGNVVIEVMDDGAGLDRDKVLAKALERGLVEADEPLSDERVYDLIFQPGFSTAEQVSDVSGRGVGMDVVRRNIKDLGGTVEVHSSPGQGSTFTIRLPLTLAILDGQLVRVGAQTYVIPLISIVESLQVRPESVSSIAAQTELYRLREEYIPVIRLYDVFDIAPDSTRLDDGLLVVVDGDGQKAGIFVDELMAQQQVVIKSLETNYRSVRGVSGATILGDGTVALILDIPGVIDCAQGEAPQDTDLSQSAGRAA